ncbi:nucleic acid-templated transcription [Homalodisca vitripennis]|nr:nucleic acid-templated transcription [Homalodisca vitripennis]
MMMGDQFRKVDQYSPKSSPRGARSPVVSRQDSTGTLKTTISLGKNPSIVHSGPFYLMKEPPVPTATKHMCTGGAFPSALGAALDCCPNFASLDIRGLMSFGLSSASGTPGDALNMISDQMPQKFSFGKPFRIVIPSRDDWSEGRKSLPPAELEWFTDGSKTKSGTGAEIVGGELVVPMDLIGCFRWFVELLKSYTGRPHGVLPGSAKALEA